MNWGEDNQTVGDGLAFLWAARFFLCFGLLCGALLALVFSQVATPRYKAQMILSPANPMNGAEMSSLLADENLYALRYLVQRVGVSNSSDFLRFENMLRGPTVAQELLERREVQAGLYHDYKFDFWEPVREWSPARFAQYIEQRVRIDPVGATNLRRVSYYHADPEFAMSFLAELHRTTDMMIRSNIRREAESRVLYLKEAISTTNNPEHRRALTTLLLEQERLRMLVSIEQPYAAAVIERPFASHKPAWPDRVLVFLIFMLGGGVLGLFVYSLRYAEPY